MPELAVEVQHAVGEIMPERRQRPVHVRLLPARTAIFAAELGAAVQTVLLVRMPVVSPGGRVDGTREHGTRRSVPDRLKIRHPTSPCAHIMRASTLMLAAVP